MKFFKSINTEGRYSLGSVANILAIPTKTLINYENTGLTEVSRSNSGRRLYSKSDMLTIVFARHMMKQEGMTVKGVIKLIQVIKAAEAQGAEVLDTILPKQTQKTLLAIIE